MRLFDLVPHRTSNLKQLALQAFTAGFILNVLYNLATDSSKNKNDKIAEQILAIVSYILFAMQCMKLLDNPQPITSLAQPENQFDFSSSNEDINESPEELEEQTPDRSDCDVCNDHSSGESLSSK